MSESLPFVETLVRASYGTEIVPSDDYRAALHALIAHCRADRTGKQNLPVAAPASASARAEAMRRLRDVRYGPCTGLDDYSARMSKAVDDLLALPEPDECAGLQGLLETVQHWLDTSPGKSEYSQGCISAYEAMRDEIRRLIAERGGKP